MTPTECVDLVEFIAGRCPAMRMQDNTPDTWYVDLREFDLAVGLEAARRVTLDKTFIGIGDLVTGCQAVVREIEGRRRQAELEAQIAAENPGELHQRDIREITTGKRVPVDDPVRVERRRELRKAAHTKRRQVEQDVEARNAYHEAMQQARAELEDLRKQQGETA